MGIPARVSILLLQMEQHAGQGIGALRGNAKIMDVHVLMEAGASGQATPHVLSPVGVGYSTEKERALIQHLSMEAKAVKDQI